VGVVSSTDSFAHFGQQLVRILILFLLLGCASRSAMRVDPAQESNADPIAPAQSSVAQSSQPEDPRLVALWERRTGSASHGEEDYPIGPGDVLTISAAGVDEIKDREVRVAAEGTIELPLLGVVQAAGLDEQALAQSLDDKLTKYMYNPQVSVFVDVYRNREVAVVGAVNKPGLVVLDSPGETILDVLTQAGGVAPTAADELVLIPGDDRVNNGAPSAKTAALEPEAATRLAGSANAVSINLHSTSLTGSGRYLSLPARPGDVLVVPGGGQVMVVGWVQNPGHFPVGSGLTVLGAVGAAGGPMYAADTKSVNLIRSETDGGKHTFTLDLDDISDGKEPDVPVKANDVVDVPYSDLRIGPYVFYSVLTRVGLAAPMIP
jgi:polysaccharide export outer membrane protein